MKQPKTLPSNRRRAFTLIELLIVIVIIAVLAALLVPAAGGAIRRARITGVVTEISQLEAAIAKFKADHGIEPPSNITLYETGTDWNGASTATVNSRALIQQIWPQFDFTKNRDLNKDGDLGAANESYTLTPSECLVLFLGGMFTISPAASSSSGPLFSMIGFSKDPTDPFAPAASGVTREAPLFEFQTSRLCDVETYSAVTFTVVGGTNGIPEYKDGLPGQRLPYLYYGTYDGQGYNESATAEFAASNSLILATPYWQGSDFTSGRWKPSSHQIISPGYDGIYGNGGPYLPSGNPHLPSGTSTPPPSPITPLPTASQRGPEADNITNFSGGELGQ